MKKIGLLLGAIVLVLFIGVLGGCSQKNSPGLNDFMTLEEYEGFVEGGKTGFLFITSENGEDFKAQKALIEHPLTKNKITAETFNDYMADGKNINQDGMPTNPYRTELSSDSLHYIKDGEVIDTLKLNNCDCLDINTELDLFLKKYEDY